MMILCVRALAEGAAALQRRAFVSVAIGLALQAFSAAALAACAVYDDDALKRRGASPSDLLVAPDAGVVMVPAKAVVGLDGSVSESSKENLPASSPHNMRGETPADARAADAAGRASAGIDGGHKVAAPDSGARMPTDASAADSGKLRSDSGVLIETDSGLGSSMESGFCSACDSASSVAPVLSDSGGMGNVTTLGSVSSPSPSVGGACNYGTTKINYFAAINVDVRAGDMKGQWQGGRLCGQCAAVRVKTEQGWKEAVVRIVDKCGDPNCGIALGGAPAKDLMGERPGRYEGSWRFVSCDAQPQVSDGSTSIRVKEGSNQQWSLIQVRNPPQAVVAIDWKSADGSSAGTLSVATEAENYFSVPAAVHKSETIHLIIHYRDATTVEVDVQTKQLAMSGAEIALQ